MPYTRRRDPADPGRFGRVLAAVAVALLVASCSAGGHPRSTGPTTTLLTADRWSPPALTGGPSTQNFCAVVVAVYMHMAQLPFAATTRVKEQILGDYVSTAPTMVAAAPPPVAADAKAYIPGVAVILGDLRDAGLNGKKITDPRVADLLLDPRVKAAGRNVIAFVQDNCHYTIGS